MAMKLVKKTAEYSIYQRGDNRYAVKDGGRNAVNGDEKTRILIAEELIKATLPAAPAIEEAPEADTASEDVAAEEATAEESPAEEAVEAEAPVEEPAEETEK